MMGQNKQLYKGIIRGPMQIDSASRRGIMEGEFFFCVWWIDHVFEAKDKNGEWDQLS